MSTFTVDGLDGITFTAEFNPGENWLTISGHDRDGDLVSKSGISVTPDPIEDIAVTPEVVVDPESDLTADAEDHFIEALEAEGE